MLNKVQLIGRLGQDPEFKIAGGADLLSMSIATTEKWKNKQGEQQERTEWHKVQFWGPVAKIAAHHLKKGSLVFVEGKIQTRSYEKDGQKRYSTEIVGSTVKFLADYVTKSSVYNEDHSSGEPGPQFNTSDDIPF
jgi:single-strand DNA-binding protein